MMLIESILLVTLAIIVASRAPPASKTDPKTNSKANRGRTLGEPASNPKKTASIRPEAPGKQGLTMIDYTEVVVEANVSPDPTANPLRTAERTFTAKEIANEHGVSDTAIRRNWYRWIGKVAPEALLKDGKAYTSLAHTLFAELAAVHKKERELWVNEAKKRYAQEWGAVGVIDCEVMPAEVGGTLATLTSSLALSQQNFALELADVNDFIEQLNAAEANISEAEVASWAAAGQAKAVAQFKTTEIAKQQTLNALRQQRLQGGQQA